MMAVMAVRRTRKSLRSNPSGPTQIEKGDLRRGDSFDNVEQILGVRVTAATIAPMKPINLSSSIAMIR